MKKILSVVLAIAIVLGTIGMVSFANVTWTADAGDVTGFKVSIIAANNGANKYLRGGNLPVTQDMVTEETLPDSTVDRYVLFRYRVYNLSDTAAYITMFAQGGSNGWKGLTDVSYPGNSNSGSGEQNIPANSSLIFTIKVPVTENYKVTEYADAATPKTEYALTTLAIRLDIGANRNVTAGQNFVVEALNEVSMLYVNKLAVGAGTGGADIFDVTEKITGTAAYNEYMGAVKLEVTNATINNAGMIVFGTKDNATDGVVFEDCPDYTGALEVSYTVYNPTDKTLRATLRFSRRGYWGYNAGNNLATSDITIPAQSKAVLTNSINVENGNLTLDSQEISASDIRVRMNLNYASDAPGVLANGDVFYIQPASHYDPMFYGTSSNNGFKRTVVGSAALPNLEMMATPTPVATETPTQAPTEAPTVAPTPSVVGTKFEIKTDMNGNTGINDYNRSPWVNNASFTGTKTLEYVVYNVSDKTIKVTLNTTMLVGTSTKTGDGAAVASVTIPAGYKGNLSVSFPVTNGVASIKEDGTITGNLNLIRLRFYMNGNLTVGDAIILEAVQDGDSNNFIAESFSASGVTKTTGVAVPNYSYTPAPTVEPTATATPTATPTEAPTEAPTATPTVAPTVAPTPSVAGTKFEITANKNGDTSINDYGRSPWANDASFTGQKKLQYVVYNTSNKEIKVTLSITILLEGRTYGGDAETIGTVTIPAGYKGDLSALVNVENGVAKLKADGSRNGNLNLIRVRFIMNGNLTAGDAIIIESIQDGDTNSFLPNSFSASGVTKTTVNELPTLNYTPVPTVAPTADPTPVPTQVPTTAPTGAPTGAPNYVGVKLEVTNDAVNNSGLAIFAKTGSPAIFADDANFSGTKQISYVVYNASDKTLQATLYVCSIGKYQTAFYEGVLIPAGEKAVVTAEFDVVSGMVDLGDAIYPLSELRARFNLNFNNIVNGDVYYIAPAETNANDPIFSGTSSNNGFTVSYVTELPNLPTMATPTPTVAPTADPTPVPTQAPGSAAGVKFEVKEDTSTAISINDYGRSPWANNASFTGQKKLQYVVYNTSNKEVKVTLSITILLEGRTHGGDAETIGTVTIPAGYKGDLSALVNVENGIAKLKADGTKDGALNLIRLRFTATFTGGAEAGDSILIAPVLDGDNNDFVINKFSAGGVNKSEVATLPNYNYAPAPTPTPVPTQVPGASQTPGTTQAPGATAKPAGIKFTSTEVIANNATHYGTFEETYFANDETFTGKKEATYKFYNTSNHRMTVKIAFKVTDDGWHSYNAGQATATIEPGFNASLTAFVDVKDGKVTINNKEYDLSKVSIRVDAAFEEEAIGDSFIMTCDDSNDPIFLSNRTLNKMSKEAVYSLPADPTPAPTPIGAKLEVTKEEVNNSGLIIFAKDGSPAIFEDDADFTGTKKMSYVIYNASKKDLSATLYTCSVGKYQTDFFKTVVIPANKKAVVTVEFEVVNGEVELGGEKYPLSEIRARFNLNFKKIVNGDVYYIAPANDVENDPLFAGTSSNNGFKVTYVSEIPEMEYLEGFEPDVPSEDGATEEEPGEDKVYIGAEFVQNEPSAEQHSLCNWGGGKFLENDPNFNGTISHKYIIYNTGASAMKVNLLYNNDKGRGSSVEGSFASATVLPGKKVELEIAIKFVDGVATLNDAGETATLSQLRLRLNVKFEEEVEGNKFVIASATDDPNDYFVSKYENAAFTKTLLTKAELPVVKVAVGITISTTDEADGSGKFYLTTTTSGGLCTSKDVKDGILTKTYKFRNNGESAIEVKLDLQALAGGSWKSPEGKECDWILIEPGKTVEVTCSVPVENGMVTIAGEEVSISKLFGKFSFRGEDGTLPEGTSFTIFFAENEESHFANMIGEAKMDEGWSSEIIFAASGAPTGDVLPVAIIATVMLAAVLFVVVSKKRKED